MLNIGIQFFHFILLFTLLYVFVIRKQFPTFVKNRHETFRDQYAKIQADLKDSQKKFEEYNSRLKAIDAEVSAIRSQVREEAEATKVRILSDSKRLSGVIVSDAKSNTLSMADDLKRSLREELVEVIMTKAVDAIKNKMTQDDLKRIRQGFSANLTKDLTRQS